MTQISVVLTARDDLNQKKKRLESEISQQSQEQNDIYQYLRKKLKDNYVAIAALETKVRKGISHVLTLFIPPPPSDNVSCILQSIRIDSPLRMQEESSIVSS